MVELNEIRDQGIAFDGGERAEGIRCVAAPIIDNTTALIGTISVSGTSSRIKEERFREEIPELVQTQQLSSGSTLHTPSHPCFIS